MPVSAEAIGIGRLTVLERDPECLRAEPAPPVDLGPLLAVCGLTGGAGATTLAYLVALAAAQQKGGPVLVADTGGPSGGLAALAGIETPQSLMELACQLAAGKPLEDGVRDRAGRGARARERSRFCRRPRARAACTTDDRRPRGAPADRDRLRHTRPRRRPRRARRRHPHRLGAARDRRRRQPRAAGAGGRARGRGEGACCRTARGAAAQGAVARAAVHRERATGAAGACPAPPWTRIRKAGPRGAIPLRSRCRRSSER